MAGRQQLFSGIEITLRNGQRLKVFLETVVGDFAVHRRIWGNGPVDTGWTVTHIPSGIAFWTVAELPAAVRVAQWLDKSKLVPADPDQAWAWKEALHEPDKSKLIRSLTEVAPRFVPDLMER